MVDEDAVRGDDNAAGDENATLGDEYEVAEEAGDEKDAVNETLDEEFGDADVIFGAEDETEAGINGGDTLDAGDETGGSRGTKDDRRTR